MTKNYTDTNVLDSEKRITLNMLSVVHNSDNVSQRVIAKDLSIALGLANTYLKRLIKKGLIKVKQAPANRYAYYLTPKGFIEKTRLTAEYLSQSLDLFRITRNEAKTIYNRCQKENWARVAILGEGDLVDIFAMSVPTKYIELSVYRERSLDSDKPYENIPIISQDKLKYFDAVIICDMKNPIYYYELAAKTTPLNRILAPQFLDIDKSAVTGKGQ